MTATRPRDLYEILGIDKNADEKTIKSAYRKLAKKYHPDTNPGDAEAERRFKEINAAWQILSNKEKRRQYDEYGPVSLEEGFDETMFKNRRSGSYGTPFDWGDMGASGGTWHFSTGTGTHFHFEGVDDDILAEIFSGIFNGSGGKEDDIFGGRGRTRVRRGKDLEATADIPFTTAALGGEVRVKTPDGAVMCRIPAGIQDGTRIRLKGKGGAGSGGGENGDLYLAVRIKVPKNLSDAARRKLRELEDLL